MLSTPPNSPITQTDFGYTGQRNLDSGMGGLMDYHARFYSPMLGRFTQPDTIILQPINPQDWNRYSYGLNNPSRYIDPSGHVSCEGSNWDDGPQCAKKPEFWHTAIHNDFKWKAASDFSVKELQTIYQVGVNIKTYVDNLTDGKGSEWMNKVLGGTTFVHGTLPYFGNPYTTGSTVHLSENYPAEWITHELGHVWDNRMVGPSVCMSLNGCGPSRQDLTYRFCDATICGGGNADLLQQAIGGNPAGLRAWNGTSGVPEGYQWLNSADTDYGYGNNGTAEYFAQAFRYMIYDQSTIPHSAQVVSILTSFIQIEASGAP